MLFFRYSPLSSLFRIISHVAKANIFSTSFFKTLVDHEVTVELKNDIQIRGTLKSVDQYLNIKLDDITVVEEVKYPHLVGLGCDSLRFSVVKERDEKRVEEQ
jgi:U6 snRNA-associated Sm-like protein LSm2